jgi:hypothetical protein
MRLKTAFCKSAFATHRINRVRFEVALFVIVPLSFGASTAICQSRAPAWCNVPGTSGYAGACQSSGGTRTIVIEREVIYKLGPPITVWKLPSVEGATSSDMAPISNRNLQIGAGNESAGPYGLYHKARRALRDGDSEKALIYLNAALQRAPSASEADDILALKREAQRKFDESQAAKFRFQKSDRQTELVEIDVDGVPDNVLAELSNPKRMDKDIEAVRRELFPLFVAQSDARKKAKELEKMSKLNGQGTGGSQEQNAVAAEIKKAEVALDAAEKIVRAKVEEKKEVILKLVPRRDGQ